MVVKKSISLPLEAGPSVLDVHVVPPHLVAALEYVAARLARKSLALDLVLVRRDYQLPSMLPPPPAAALAWSDYFHNHDNAAEAAAATAAAGPLTASSSSSSMSSSMSSSAMSSSSMSSAFSITSASGSQSRFAAPVSAIKHFVRSASRRASDPVRPPTTRHRSLASHASLPFGLDSIRRTASLAPSSLFVAPQPPSPVPHQAPPPFGVCLVHDPSLSSRAHRTLCAILARAEQKFAIGGPWFSHPVTPAACGLPAHLFNSSLVQNEILFASSGLSLVSLDRFFSLKCALSSYSMTRSPLRLDDAVDELHRFVLANNGTRVSRTALLRAYDWLSLSDDTISHLDCVYRRAYGGPRQVGAIAGMPESAFYFEPMPSACLYEDDMFCVDSTYSHLHDIGLAVTTPDASLPPSPPVPALTLQTDVASTPRATDSPRWPWQDDDDDDDDDGARTALPGQFLSIGFDPCAEPYLSRVQSTKPVILSAQPLAQGYEPMTPKTCNDISPITRGEWRFLMEDKALRNGRTVAVETC